MLVSHTGIDFENTLVEDTTFNFLNYLYFYNGGGVAAGDVNNDGLDDLFFTSNQNENKLYLNQGDFRFEDVTQSSGIIHQDGSWSTGVAMVDLNGDGWLDIFVSNVNYLTRTGKNQFFENNQDGTFTEKAKDYGLDLEAYSVQAAFLDFDKDGDLDLFQLNHSVHSIYSYAPVQTRERVDPKSGDRLFRNDGDVFTDVSEEAGIFSSALGFGLGVTISDVNEDGWPDIYVANDFHEDDYLYINQKNGTFKESIRESVQHISQFTMSVDIGDINNDGKNEIVTTDMLPFDEQILKKSGGGDTYQIARIKENYGYYPQYARNMLQLNVGTNSNGNPIYSEIGYLAGIEATDWSWSGLLADLDNDGYRDFYIANGIYRRPNDLDYIKFISSSDVQASLEIGIDPENLKLVQKMPQLQIPNAVFRNNGDLTFTDLSGDWGLGEDSYSNGAAYSDLDNDGDLDLIVNNVNQPAFIYKNNSINESKVDGNYLQFHLMGEGKNTAGISAKIYVYAGENQKIIEQSPVKGFQSTVSPVMHIGLGRIQVVDSVRIIWPDDRTQIQTNPGLNKLVHFSQSLAVEKFIYANPTTDERFFVDVTDQTGINFNHSENDFIDFDFERLIPHYQSTLGGPVAVADVNGDGLEDVFVGNANGNSGEIWIQNQNSRFTKLSNPGLEADFNSEDTDAVFFDANNDEYPDLFITSGGGVHIGRNTELVDRLYINNGTGVFTKSETFPITYSNSSTVSVGDFDNDGDQDLFVGSSSIPGSYGENPRSYLFQNDGQGNFEEVTEPKSPILANIGMVTDSDWKDIDSDGDLDLIIAGEWMPITIIENQSLNDGGNTSSYFSLLENDVLRTTSGWWNTIELVDIDQDGDQDIVGGNLGLNSYLSASLESPLRLYVNDFDSNRRGDAIITREMNGKEYPIAMVDELFEQMNSMKREFIDYTGFVQKDFNTLFDSELINTSLQKEATMFESVVIENLGNSEFEIHQLPKEAQFSPIYDFHITDLNNDGSQDVFANGNFSGVRPFFGKYDSNFGTVLLNNGDFEFEGYSSYEHERLVGAEIRNSKEILFANGDSGLIIQQNDGELIILKNNQQN